MDLTDYTSFDDIRAALGVSVDEISDATLSLDLFVFNLVSELEGIDLGLIPYFEPLTLIDIDGAPAGDRRFFQATKLFATYAVAKQACASMPMFGPKEQTDGKASLVRFSQDPYKVTTERVAQQYEAAKVRLETAYAATQNAGAPVISDRPYLSVVSPDYDPVSG